MPIFFVAECRTLPSFATEDGARWHCSCFKFELESFHFPRRRIGVYFPSVRYLFCNSAVAVSRYVVWVAAAARSVAGTNTTRTFEIRIGLSLEQVQGRKLERFTKSSKQWQARQGWLAGDDLLVLNTSLLQLWVSSCCTLLAVSELQFRWDAIELYSSVLIMRIKRLSEYAGDDVQVSVILVRGAGPHFSRNSSISGWFNRNSSITCWFNFWLALAASCTESARGPCAGPQTIPRSPLLAKVRTKFTHLLL